MPHTLESFAAACRQFLSEDPGPSGRENVRKLLSEVLLDKAFVAAHLGPDNTTEKTVIYEDPKLGFQILAHVNLGAKASPPHDHGTTWAIYGQAVGETEMSEWDVVAKGANGKPTEVKLEKTYVMKPGDAYLYNEYKVHSPKREGPTRLIRITGRDVDKLRRTDIAVAA
ncbi:MAG: hypothetical protein O3A84_14975 [Proteobacteria bacterium]|nr:hypothetical protein [Pseudomonadota bacterium]